MIGLPSPRQVEQYFFGSVPRDIPPSSMIRTNWLQIFWPPGIFIKKMVRLYTMSHLWIILTFIICRRRDFLRAEENNK